MQINPYLLFDGCCEEAFNCYAELLGGQIVAMLKHRDTPAAGHTSPEWQDKIIHGRIVIGGQVLMGSDAPPEYQEKPQGMRVSISVDTPEEAERIYNGLNKDAQITMPLDETFWAYRFAMLTDRFGTPWMINCEKPMG